MALLFAHDARMHAACPPRSHSERGNARGHTLRESHIWNGVMWNRVGLDAGFMPGCGFRARHFGFQDGFQDSCVTILSRSDGRTVHTLSDTTAQLARRFLGMADAHTLLTADNSFWWQHISPPEGVQHTAFACLPCPPWAVSPSTRHAIRDRFAKVAHGFARIRAGFAPDSH